MFFGSSVSKFLSTMIIVLDFGSQYSHLITRRVRELGFFAELKPPTLSLKELQTADAVILSGGPQNLSEKGALRVSKRVFSLGVPILGICYGLQLMAYELGGRVVRGQKREYGPAVINITKSSPIFRGLPKKQLTWMSHGDKVDRLPKGFVQLASSKNCEYSAMANEQKQLYGLQFHPEVVHTEYGSRILKNFLNLTRAKPDWSMQDFIKESVARIKARVGQDKTVCALSGGVDSGVAATLVNKAIGKNLFCIYVDTGLMRKNETAEIKQGLKKLKLNLKIIDAETEFLKELKGVTHPEKKRKIVGRLFIKIFEREAKKISSSFPSPHRGRGKKGEGEIKWLVQGTLYTDAITSGVSVTAVAALIKSHHNVGGLPKQMGLGLIEPLRELYKDEVRRVAALLNLPTSIRQRQPFPGPGLAVRIIGEVSRQKLDILREADAIVREEVESAARAGVHPLPEQYFAVLPDIKSVGVQGDARTYGHPIIVRAVTTKDFMTAHWTKLPSSVLERISVRITNEIPEINRVVYDITSKPPATVEWE